MCTILYRLADYKKKKKIIVKKKYSSDIFFDDFLFVPFGVFVSQYAQRNRDSHAVSCFAHCI